MSPSSIPDCSARRSAALLIGGVAGRRLRQEAGGGADARAHACRRPPAPTPTPTPPPAPVERRRRRSPDQHTEDYAAGVLRLRLRTRLRDDARTALDGNAKLLRDNPEVTPHHRRALRRARHGRVQPGAGRKARPGGARLPGGGRDRCRGGSTIISYGKERPFATGSDEASWQQNRRAHFVVRASS